MVLGVLPRAVCVGEGKVCVGAWAEPLGVCILRVRGLVPGTGLLGQDKAGPLQRVPSVLEGWSCVCVYAQRRERTAVL